MNSSLIIYSDPEEPPGLVDSFVEKFKETNYFYDVWTQRNPSFRDRIDSCEIAIFLISSKLINPSNENREKLKLLALGKKKNVLLVGVLLRDTNEIIEWTKNNKINLFSVNFGELPRTAESLKGFKDSLAPYEQIKMEDYATFHKKLKEYIQQLVNKKLQRRSINRKSGLQLRSKEKTKKILEIMIESSLIKFIEERLSNSKDFWEKTENTVPISPDISYSMWFFCRQKKFYSKCIDKVLGFYFPRDYDRLFSSILQRNEILLDLCGEEKNNQLFQTISALNDQIEEIMGQIGVNSNWDEVRFTTINYLANPVRVLDEYMEEAFARYGMKFEMLFSGIVKDGEICKVDKDKMCEN